MRHSLALLGGERSVPTAPKNRWPVFTEQDAQTAARMVRDAEVCYTNRRGHVKDLEDRFRAYFDAEHALALNSGTSALHAAYFGAGLAPGDEVLSPTYTFLATVTPLYAVGAIPVLGDVDRWTGNLDPDRLEAAITPKTKAIVVTHLNGFPVDMLAVMSVARRHRLKVIEDCSQAHGAICAGQKVGTFGDAAAFSLQAKKLVTAGEGGILLTKDQDVHERAVLMTNFADRSRTEVTSPRHRPFIPTGFGHNYRMHPIGAALAANTFARLPRTIENRTRNLDHLSRLLSDVPGVVAPVVQSHMDQVAPYSYQPIYQASELDGLPIDTYVAALAAEGVPVTRPSSPPLHREPIFSSPDPAVQEYGGFSRNGGRRVIYREGDFPASEKYVATALRLPVYTDDVRGWLDRCAEAFAKVADHHADLFEVATGRPVARSAADVGG